MTMTPNEHTPVLVREVIDLLQPTEGDIVLDGTIGDGGHAAAILKRMGEKGSVIGFDLDADALQRAQARLAPFGERVRFVRGSYHVAPALLAETWPGLGITKVLLDLGMSSMELSVSGRGFSFLRPEEPLDMRFDPSIGRSAAELLNHEAEQKIAAILKENGEEPLAVPIARVIVERRRERPFSVVGDLVPLLLAAYGRRFGGRSRSHPATRTFQALRIAVNDELEHLTSALPALVALLPPGGRIAVISFHSLEDRIVKRFFQRESTDCLCPPSFPECRCGHRAQLTVLTKHVVTPSEEEQTTNPRSRSAKLRAAEKKFPA